MAYTTDDLVACERQILKLQTEVKLGDNAITYDSLLNQIVVRNMIINDLAKSGSGLGGRPRSWQMNTCKGLR